MSESTIGRDLVKDLQTIRSALKRRQERATNDFQALAYLEAIGSVDAAITDIRKAQHIKGANRVPVSEPHTPPAGA